jgi:hypothetical protein
MPAVLGAGFLGPQGFNCLVYFILKTLNGFSDTWTSLLLLEPTYHGIDSPHIYIGIYAFLLSQAVYETWRLHQKLNPHHRMCRLVLMLSHFPILLCILLFFCTRVDL